MQNAKTARILAHGANGRTAPRRRQARPSVVEGAPFKVFTQTLAVVTRDPPHFVDVTAEVKGCLARSGVTAGQVLVFSTHTTAAIKINEHEPLLHKDMAHFLDRAAPKDSYYGHNDFAIRTVNMHEDECPNGHSHCQHLILGTSETIPVAGGKLVLGQYQRVFLIELDHPMTRHFVVQVMGL
jgi:secondary thiamine-phosphate synthase enzyme